MERSNSPGGNPQTANLDRSQASKSGSKSEQQRKHEEDMRKLEEKLRQEFNEKLRAQEQQLQAKDQQLEQKLQAKEQEILKRLIQEGNRYRITTGGLKVIHQDFSTHIQANVNNERTAEGNHCFMKRRGRRSMKK